MHEVGKPCKCLAKSTQRELGGPRFSMNWARARRGLAKFYPDHLKHGDRIVRFADVEVAKRYAINGLFPWSKGYLLQLETSDALHSFGLQRWCDCFDKLDLKIEDSGSAQLAYSKGSILLRILSIGVIGYWILHALT